jgi:hypothetical protein
MKLRRPSRHEIGYAITCMGAGFILSTIVRDSSRPILWAAIGFALIVVGGLLMKL